MDGRRNEPRDRDPDNWFADRGPAAATPEQSVDAPPTVSDRVPAAGADESWFGAEPIGRARNASVLDLASERWVRILAGLLLLGVLLAGGLVIGGAFSGSKHPATRPARASSRVTTTVAAATTAASPAVPTVPTPAATLKPGDQGSAVTALQKALASLGDPAGAIDGNYGPSTQRAVARFQAGAHLTADGILGPATLAALASALQGP